MCLEDWYPYIFISSFGLHTMNHLHTAANVVITCYHWWLFNRNSEMYTWHYFVSICLRETCTRHKGHVSFSFKHLSKTFWSSIYLTSEASKLCRNTHTLSHQEVTKLLDGHTNWNGLPLLCYKIIQYQISWKCIQTLLDVTHIQMDKFIFNKHSAEMWTNLKIYYTDAK
jgi:hypothetical protein